MESIIEDQVTSVFEAEELRSWNLLTRTNRLFIFQNVFTLSFLYYLLIFFQTLRICIMAVDRDMDDGILREVLLPFPIASFHLLYRRKLLIYIIVELYIINMINQLRTIYVMTNNDFSFHG